jgi:AraC-like DNA-binding protein
MDLISTITIVGIVQGVFILFLILSNEERNLKTIFAVFLFLLFIIDLIWYFIYLQGLLPNFKFLNGIDYLVLYLYGPILYLYVKAHFESEKLKLTKKKLLFHFLPAIIIYFLMSPILLGNKTIDYLNSFKLLDYKLFATYSLHSIFFDFILVYFHVILYLIFTVILIKKSISKNSFIIYERNSNHLDIIRILFYTYLSFPIISLTIFILNPFVEINISTYDFSLILLVFHIFVISYIGYKNQNLLTNPIKLLKKQSSNLKNININKLRNNLDLLINTDQIFLDKNLTLVSLSKVLNVTSHQLSEFLNSNKKKSFNDFINSYRINYAKKLLLNTENDIYTLDGISSKSGFKSLATFHRNFKKQTGTTPLKWLEKEKINN